MLKKLLTRKMPKKRYLILGLLALEIASLPAAAQIIDRVIFSVEPQTSAVLVDDINGVKRFAVASNSPFFVTADNYVGDITVEVHKSGQLGTSRFGDNAQMPGAAMACSSVSFSEQTIYQAERKTAAKSGDILSQAVILVISHDPSADALIRITSGNALKPLAASKNCASKIS